MGILLSKFFLLSLYEHATTLLQLVLRVVIGIAVDHFRETQVAIVYDEASLRGVVFFIFLLVATALLAVEVFTVLFGPLVLAVERVVDEGLVDLERVATRELADLPMVPVEFPGKV